VPVRAVTAWSLLGVFDWNTLVTRPSGHYEPGVFDLRGAAPRPTALAQLVRELASGQRPQHPVLTGVGWWHRPERFLYACPCAGPGGTTLAEAPVMLPLPTATRLMQLRPRASRPLLVTGATGTLGQAFARICAERGLAVVCTTRQELEITDPQAIADALARHQPWAVINTAGYVRVDQAEHEREICFRANTLGPALLAEACTQQGTRLLTFSSDLVFDGTKREPYLEDDAVGPLNVYGQSKAMAEQAVLDVLPEALVVRTSAFFGPWDRYNFVWETLRTLAAGGAVMAANDSTVSPTYVPDLVHACLDLLIDGERGLWHLANTGAVSWAELAHAAAYLAGYDTGAVEGVPGAQLRRLASQPRYSVLGSARATLLPPLDDALARCVHARAHQPPARRLHYAVLVGAAVGGASRTIRQTRLTCCRWGSQGSESCG
jgi:dTDP-4-dehydrorhamnose reductase